MSKEISRTIKGNIVVVEYDDGSIKEFALQERPTNNLVDADGSLGKGHVFTEDELRERGNQ